MSLLDTASLIVTPNGYKEGKLYSVIPSDGSGDLSVTRATTATRVNSAGLVELVPYNLAQYSQTFTNGVWGAAGYGNVATIVANDAIAPDGTMTASKATFTAGLTQGRLVQSISTTNGQAYNASFYVKQGNKTTINFYSDAAVFGTFITFNFNTGTITNSNNIYGSDVENVGNGWYRISFWSYAPSSTAQFGFITFGGEDGFCYIWGSQFEQNTTATTYQKTETRLNIPRLDYSNGTCPSILVEPQRTNLALWSSSFDNAFWGKDNNGSGTLPVVTANYATSPDGTTSADRIQFTNIGGSGSAANYSLVGAFPLSLPSTGTATFYMKSNTSSNQNVLCYWGAGQGDVFQVTTEWQRFSLDNLSASGTSNLAIGTRGGTGNFYSGGDEVLDILVWGAQLEVGSYPTSYIPTTSASVTRNADVISKTGISSLIGQTEGTLFWDVDFQVVANNDAIFIKDNASYDTFVFMQKESSGIIACGYYGSGALQARIESSAVPTGRYKIAFAYKNNDFVMYLNGTQVGTDTSGTVSGLMDYFDLHWTESGCNNTNASALWKTRLTNTQLAQLTTI